MFVSLFQFSFASADMKEIVLKKHNDLRAEVFDINKYQLNWDNKLANDAQNWANYLADNYNKSDKNKIPHSNTFEPNKHNFNKPQ
jgi:hypothetical protein